MKMSKIGTAFATTIRGHKLGDPWWGFPKSIYSMCVYEYYLK